MKAHHKSILLLAVMLSVGVLLGASGTSVLQNRRVAQLRQAREAGGMMRMVEAAIGIEDESQRDRIRAVIQESQEGFRETRRTCSDMFQARHDSMMANLRTVLSPDQQDALDAWIAQEHSRQRDGRGRKSDKRDHRRNK